jgi:class 3 adenylate cyclase
MRLDQDFELEQYPRDGIESRGVAARNAAADVVTFVFTDMEGSARLIERMGDREAHELFEIHDDIIRGQLASFGAREVGNTVMAFCSPSKTHGPQCLVPLPSSGALQHTRAPVPETGSACGSASTRARWSERGTGSSGSP